MCECSCAGQGWAEGGAAARAHPQLGAADSGAGRQTRPASKVVLHRAMLAVSALPLLYASMQAWYINGGPLHSCFWQGGPSNDNNRGNLVTQARHVF